MKNHEKPGMSQELHKNVTDAGSQLTFEIGEGGRAGITQKRY